MKKLENLYIKTIKRNSIINATYFRLNNTYCHKTVALSSILSVFIFLRQVRRF